VTSAEVIMVVLLLSAQVVPHCCRPMIASWYYQDT